MAGRGKQRSVEDFSRRYRASGSDVMRQIQREIFGANVGVNGYTTIAQADALVERLGLRRGVWLLDVGAGQGWPGLYLAEKTGCQVVLSDLPLPGLRTAQARARKRRLLRRCAVVRAEGARLPFRARAFDAAVHTDVL